MNILKPELYEIGGRVYCNYNQDEEAPSRYYDEFEQKQTNYEDLDDEPSCIVDDRIERLDDDRYQMKLAIPSAFYKYVIGKAGQTKTKIENQTKTRITIPKRGVEGKIQVTGTSKRSVESAANRIELLVDSKRWNEPFTHFVSISVANEEVKSNLIAFKRNILENFSTQEGVDDSIFQRPGRIHLTICTLVLLNDSEIEKANTVLNQCRGQIISEILQNKSLEVVIEGLEYMNDDPSAVDVLYAKVRCKDDSNALQDIADTVMKHFVDAGLTQQQYEKVKLHATVINTKYRREDETNKTVVSNVRFKQQRETFSATAILNSYLDYNFGHVNVDKIQISVSGAKKDLTGYYQSAGAIELSS